MSITPPRAPPEALTITQLCRQSGTTPRALRFYEQKGLLSPRRVNQARLYSRREKARLQLILQGRRAGFTLGEVRELFDAYDNSGPGAQLVRALPLFRARLAALELEREAIDDALETLRVAAQRMAARRGETLTEASDPSIGAGEFLGQAASPPPSSSKRRPLRDLV